MAIDYVDNRELKETKYISNNIAVDAYRKITEQIVPQVNLEQHFATVNNTLLGTSKKAIDVLRRENASEIFYKNGTVSSIVESGIKNESEAKFVTNVLDTMFDLHRKNTLVDAMSETRSVLSESLVAEFENLYKN